MALRNCPTSAIPGGPIILATTFTDTKPVIIFIIVDTADHADTFTKSVLATRYTPDNIFFNEDLLLEKFFDRCSYLFNVGLLHAGP